MSTSQMMSKSCGTHFLTYCFDFCYQFSWSCYWSCVIISLLKLVALCRKIPFLSLEMKCWSIQWARPEPFQTTVTCFPTFRRWKKYPIYSLQILASCFHHHGNNKVPTYLVEFNSNWLTNVFVFVMFNYTLLACSSLLAFSLQYFALWFSLAMWCSNCKSQ